MRITLTWLVGFMLIAATTNGQGFVNKLKQKASQAAEKAVEKKATETTNSGNANENSDSSPNQPSNGRPVNKGGAGLVSTPPDVNNNLDEAESSYKAGNYSAARYAVQQAMLGVEMEIGQNILKSLPEKVSSLGKVGEEDQVTSTGYGWAGLTIQRVYRLEDKELRATIANNSAMMSAVNMYLANGGYSQTTNGQQNWKQTKVKGHKAIIEYDENSGYKLSVPLGQSSLVVWEGVNFANEQEIMSAANSFDIDGIKKTLGEQ